MSSSSKSRFLWPVVWSLLGLGALVALVTQNEEAREVAIETSKTLFGIFTTPFIFESTVAVIGILIVLGINHWRISREGDGWVYMVTHEPEEGSESLPPAITQRLQGVILASRPEVLDEGGASRLMIEGFLEMGMAAQAQKELADLGNLPADAPSAVLRIRVAAANLDTDHALALLRDSATHLARHEMLWTQTARECAEWLEAHAPQQKTAISLWQREAAGKGTVA